jgi:hypothetical protein
MREGGTGSWGGVWGSGFRVSWVEGHWDTHLCMAFA